MSFFNKVKLLYEDNIILINDCIKKDRETTKLETNCFEGELYKDNWYLYNNEWYYFKGLYNVELIVNEILGSIIAEYLNLPTIHYNLAKQNYNGIPIIGLVSKNFKEKNKIYLDGYILKQHSIKDYKNLKILKNICYNTDDYNSLVNQVVKKCALEIFSSQIDSVAANWIFEKDGNNTNLAPLFDYAMSFNTSYKNKYYDFDNTFFSYTFSFPSNLINKNLEYRYGNFMFMLQLPSKDFTSLVKKYDSFNNSIYKLLYFDIEKSLKDIEDNYGIIIPDNLKKHYIKEVDCKKKLFRYSL